MNWYLAVLRKYTVFDGRASRTEYWMYTLVNVLVIIALAIVDRMLGLTLAHGFGLLGSIYGLAVLLPGIGVCIRRLHDSGRSGWWVLIALVPLVGGIVLLVFMVLDSQPGDNDYGPNPKGQAAPAMS